MNQFDKLYKLILQSIDNVISLQKITNFNEEELDLIHKGLNLSAHASDDEQWSRQNLGQNIKERMQHGHNYYYIKNNNKIIGVVQIGVYESKACISNFAIFEQYQGQHLGKRALQEIIKFINQKYPNINITLGVAKCNTKAQSLYKKLGFKITNQWERGMQMELENE